MVISSVRMVMVIYTFSLSIPSRYGLLLVIVVFNLFEKKFTQTLAIDFIRIRYLSNMVMESNKSMHYNKTATSCIVCSALCNLFIQRFCEMKIILSKDSKNFFKLPRTFVGQHHAIK